MVASLIDVDGEKRLVAQHDGYLARFGIIHERRLTLDASGCVLEGIDVLRPPSGTLRLPRDVPLALHFHLPVEARWSGAADGGLGDPLVDLELGGRERERRRPGDGQTGRRRSRIAR